MGYARQTHIALTVPFRAGKFDFSDPERVEEEVSFLFLTE